MKQMHTIVKRRMKRMLVDAALKAANPSLIEYKNIFFKSVLENDANSIIDLDNQYQDAAEASVKNAQRLLDQISDLVDSAYMKMEAIASYEDLLKQVDQNSAAYATMSANLNDRYIGTIMAGMDKAKIFLSDLEAIKAELQQILTLVQAEP